ncbi:pre-rRNA-processing protein TSR1 homolog [Bacillus rossius redtenbacheri]|uniref:pre-rRNA-processing protein TSR1 homolog n=1 Tax=Bacillus rossius redtenbacheri TaxID=93214 RepID=UPI002FDE4005
MVSNPPQECHRPGLLKQQNKSHKHGRHRSKGSVSNALKGKVSVKTFTKKARHELKREERRNQALQLRLKKRDETLTRKRSLGGSATAPFLVAIVSLNEGIDPVGALELIKQADSEAVVTYSAQGNVHISVPRFKQRFALVAAPAPWAGGLHGCLDLLKVADFAVLLVASSGRDALCPGGERLLLAALAQGLPSVVVATTDLQSVPPKKRQDCRQQLQRQVARWLPGEKVASLDKTGDGLALLRRVGGQKRRAVAYRDSRPHLLAEALEFVPDDAGSTGTLKVTGFVRGLPLSANGLVHIPGWGDFQASQIDSAPDPHRADARARPEDDPVRLLQAADPAKQESLVSENEPDPMEGEQTWPTAEELALAEDARREARRVRRVPRGTSEYQAAWIPDEEDADDDDGSDGGDRMNVDEAASGEDSDAGADRDDGEDCETVTMTESIADVQRYDEKLDLSEEQEALKKMKEAHMDSMFPDEVDTPVDTPARVRFQKYRGLQSFRTSPWDPAENLPRDYARIFQFENFHRTRRSVLKASRDNDDAVLPGWYVTVHVRGVPQHLWASRPASRPLALFGLLPHEHKMSVLNVMLKRSAGCPDQQPIRSKEQLVFHVGCRRFRACPVFSQHTSGSKHKYERYFQPDATVVASFFAPICFPPCPVLVYAEKKDGSQELVATGSVLSADPGRVVVKRAVLSGHPFKVHKRSAVVRFMFFSAEDVAWFKPVELRTKYGRRGHIRESLGTHGHMKCVFDGQLKSQDTVLMNLYKRVFPKWTYEPFVNCPPSARPADGMEQDGQ